MSGEVESVQPSAIFEKCSVVLVDVLGTTTSISFAKDTLFPFVIKHAEEILKSKWEDKTISEAVKKFKDGDDEIDFENAVKLVKELTENGSENIGLKTIQGLVYNTGYESGELKSHVFPDVPKCFETWAKSRKVAVYSTGSIDSQKQLFSKSVEGDLTTHISKYYDQTFGTKTEADSYKKIVEDLNVKPEEVLFLTDLIEEGTAAKTAGLSVALVAREGNNKLPESKDFAVISSFKEICFENPSKRKNTDETAVTEEPPSKVAKTDETDTDKVQSEDKQKIEQDKTEENKIEVKESEEKVETQKKVEKTETVEDEAMEVDASAHEIKEEPKKDEQKSDAPKEITTQQTVTKTDDSLENPSKKTDSKPVGNEDEPMDSADSTVKVGEEKSEVIKSKKSGNDTQDKNEADSIKEADKPIQTTKKVEETVKTEKTKDVKSETSEPKVDNATVEALEIASKVKDTVCSEKENKKEKMDKEENKKKTMVVEKESSTNGDVPDTPGETIVETDGQCDKNTKVVEKSENEVDSTSKDVKETETHNEEKKQVKSNLNNKVKMATEVIDDKVDSTEKVEENTTKEPKALEDKKVVVEKSMEKETETMETEEADSSVVVKALEKIVVEEKVKESADKSDVVTSKSDVTATTEADAKGATVAKVIITDNTDSCKSEKTKDLLEASSDEKVSSSEEKTESIEVTKALPNKEESIETTTKPEEKIETTTAKTEPDTKSDAEEKENKKDLANGLENGDSTESKIATNGDDLVDKKVNGESNETKSNGKELEPKDDKIEEIKVKKVEASTASAGTSAVSVEV